MCPDTGQGLHSPPHLSSVGGSHSIKVFSCKKRDFQGFFLLFFFSEGLKFAGCLVSGLEAGANY